ncbi:hypothetical protein D9M71_591880 [compost metagenome]
MYSGRANWSSCSSIASTSASPSPAPPEFSSSRRSRPLCISASSASRAARPSSSSACHSWSSLPSSICSRREPNRCWMALPVGQVLRKELSAWWYHWNRRSCGLVSRCGTWIWMVWRWPIRSRRPIRCSSWSGWAGRSNSTRWWANWKLRPSLPISEQISTWAPNSSSAK